MLKITVPEREFYDPKSEAFIRTKETTLTLEHSLLSISKWESKWHLAFFKEDNKTAEQIIDYVRCMCVSQEPEENVLLGLSEQNLKAINEYINDPMTATWFPNKSRGSNREIITNELIYYWMVALEIPFDPCQKWHINRLLTLIQVCNVKNEPARKMNKRSIMNQNAALNASRRAKNHSLG